VLKLNAVQVEFNQKAFLWGRRTASDQKEVERIAGIHKKRFRALESLEEIIAYRHKDLVGYQNKDYADSYLQKVEQVRVSEINVADSSDLPLTKVFAKALHRVMTYKDEYEVARLYTDGRFKKELDENFEGNIKLTFYMAPPLLSRRDPDTGHLRKMQFGGYMFNLFKIMAKFKGLRGTRFDIFGYSAERKIERELISQLNKTIETVLDSLTKNNIKHAIEIIELVLDVRGYGHVKEANYEQYQLRLNQQLKKYTNGGVETYEIPATNVA